jgi:fatty-acyl-CoA synthase
MFVRDWMGRRALSSPHKTAIIDGDTGESLTYRELNDRATRLANHLRHRCGVRSGDRVAVLAMNRSEILEAFFAVSKLTAILVPLNYRLTQSELQYIIEDCEPSVLLYESEFASTAQSLSEQLSIQNSLSFDGPEENYEQALAAAGVAAVEEEFDPEMSALIIYTSGTTGRPKGALLSHRMLTWNSINTTISWDIASTDITSVHMPLFHTGGFNVLTLPLLHVGGTVVILRTFEVAKVLEALEKHRCTLFFGVPTIFQMMLEAPPFETTDLSAMRYFISGGASCPVPLIEEIQKRGIAFTQGYGLTEVGPNCFRLGLEDAVRKAGSIGFPTFHSEARIVDEKGHDVVRGEIGELLLRGGHVCSGYWRNSEATAVALCDGWFYTGDLARQDEEGYYYIAGRAKDMIISGGENIYPAEVEAVLHKHPAIASVALIGLADPKWGEQPVAVVIVYENSDVSAGELIEFCSGKLARYKIPKQVFFVEEFPLLASGKVYKRVLKEEIEKKVNGK